MSNNNSPTAALASYLGHILSKNLGKVSNKHIGSVEQFAAGMRDCPTDGRLISLNVVNLFSCVPVSDVIRFLRNQSDGWGEHPPIDATPVRPPVYDLGMDSKLFCHLIELCLSYNQIIVNGRFNAKK